MNSEDLKKETVSEDPSRKVTEWKIPQFKAMDNNSFLCKIDKILRSNLGPEDKIIEYRAIVN